MSLVFGLPANSQLDYQVKGIALTQPRNDHDALLESLENVIFFTSLPNLNYYYCWNLILQLHLKSDEQTISISGALKLKIPSWLLFYCRRET